METLQKSGSGEECLRQRNEVCNVGENLKNSGWFLRPVLGTQESHKSVEYCEMRDWRDRLWNNNSEWKFGPVSYWFQSKSWNLGVWCPSPLKMVWGKILCVTKEKQRQGFSEIQRSSRLLGRKCKASTQSYGKHQRDRESLQGCWTENSRDEWIHINYKWAKQR